jgi:ABC-type hemin transport system ATPase subunit
LPAGDAPGQSVSVNEVRELQGVNGLVGKQKLSFKPGLNIVYGNNGAGKSGYVRLLRKLCRSITPVDLLPDAYGDSDAQQMAVIVVDRSGSLETKSVALHQQPERFLSAIRAFDAQCAATYVEKGNAIEHTPEPLAIISRCAAAQDLLSEQLRDLCTALERSLTALPQLDLATEAGRALDELSARTSLADLRKLACLTAAEKVELEELEKKLAAIRTDTSVRDEKAARVVAETAEVLGETLASCAGALNDVAVKRIRAQRTEIDSLRRALELQRATTLPEEPIKGVGGDVWREMWEAARRFAAASGASFPPAHGDACPVCFQKLDPAAESRMNDFERFVRSDLEQRMTAKTKELKTSLESLPDPSATHLRLGQGIGRLDEETAREVTTAFERLGARHVAIVAGAPPPAAPVDREIARLKELAETKAHEAASLSKLQDEAERKAIQARAAELQARMRLGASMSAVEARHGELLKISSVERVRSQLSTTALTKKQKELAKLAITDRLVDAIQREMDQVAGLEPRVEVRPGGSKGQTVLRVALKGATERPSRVLSEGEHGAVAMAFWLGELAASPGRSAIVLDDPVSSFDHLWRDAAMRRLVVEAKERQVIIFTHDLAFLHELDNEARHEGVPISVRYLTRSEEGPGVVNYGRPITQVPLGDRVKAHREQIDKQLDVLWQHNRDAYQEKAAAFLADLRRSWEMLVEDGLLKGAVKRMQARIYVYRLKRIEIPDGALKTIAEAFSRVSPKAHYEAAALTAVPSPTVLRGLVDDFEAMMEKLDAADPLDQSEDESLQGTAGASA